MNTHPGVVGYGLDKGPTAGETNYFSSWFGTPVKTCKKDNKRCGGDHPSKCDVATKVCLDGPKWQREQYVWGGPCLKAGQVAGESSVAYITSVQVSGS